MTRPISINVNCCHFDTIPLLSSVLDLNWRRLNAFYSEIMDTAMISGDHGGDNSLIHLWLSDSLLRPKHRASIILFQYPNISVCIKDLDQHKSVYGKTKTYEGRAGIH